MCNFGLFIVDRILYLIHNPQRFSSYLIDPPIDPLIDHHIDPRNAAVLLPFDYNIQRLSVIYSTIL